MRKNTFINLDSPEENQCREIYPSQESQKLLGILKDELGYNYYLELGEYIDTYFESPNMNKEEVLRVIENIASHYSGNPAFIELMGYFAWKRFFLEGDLHFLIGVAHRVYELSGKREMKKGEGEDGLLEDFYNYILQELKESDSSIQSVLPRILEILGNKFSAWLEREVNADKRTSLGARTLLARYAQYRDLKL